MALMPNEGEVQKAPNIHIEAFCYIFLSSLSRYAKEALL